MLIVVLGVLAATPAADSQPAISTAMEQFVGSCWTADFSSTVRDTHCFEPMYDGAHVRDRHEVKDGDRAIYAGETIYSVDGENVVFTYYNSLGGVGRGTVEPAGSALRFKGSMRGSPAKPPEQIDSEWRIVDQDHYEVRSLVPSASTAGNQVLRFTRQH
jgi:hypothetical protein